MNKINYTKILDTKILGCFCVIITILFFSCSNADLKLKSRINSNSSLSSQCCYQMLQIEESEVWSFYNMDLSQYSMTSEPYSFIMNKYLDLAIDYLDSWTEDIASLPLEDKIDLFLYVLSQSDLQNVDDVELESTDADVFFNALAELMNDEMNEYSGLQSLIYEAYCVAENNYDINGAYDDQTISLAGEVFTKISLLEKLENNRVFNHRVTTIPNEEINCGDPANNTISSSQIKSHKVLKYNLHMLWPNGNIRYRNYKNKCPNLTLMTSAMNTWEVASNNSIHFIEIADNGLNRFLWGLGLDYHLCLSKTNDNNVGGEADIGCTPGSAIRISDNEPFSTYLHELGHVLGLAHEIQRCDRDDYITINFDSIKTGYKANFWKLPQMFAQPYREFDFNSIMMYSSLAFSADGTSKTIEPIHINTYTLSSVLSESDIEGIRWLYN